MVTIEISKKIKEQLDEFKNYEQETYDKLIERLLKISYDEDAELLDDETLAKIKESFDDIKEGRCVTSEQLIKEL